jgi:hypothetical protein
LTKEGTTHPCPSKPWRRSTFPSQNQRGIAFPYNFRLYLPEERSPELILPLSPSALCLQSKERVKAREVTQNIPNNKTPHPCPPKPWRRSTSPSQNQRGIAFPYNFRPYLPEESSSELILPLTPSALCLQSKVIVRVKAREVTQ